LLNNQPMGFYHPSTIVKDAQRHGLKVLPVDVMVSEWNCTVVSQNRVARAPPSPAKRDGQDTQLAGKAPALRLGLRYVRGLREEAAQALLCQRKLAPFASIHDLAHRVPELRKDELNTLAEIGALNAIQKKRMPIANCQLPIELNQQTADSQTSNRLHRRDALWQVERAVRRSGPLVDDFPEPDAKSPLAPMNAEERLVADFRGTGMTVGPHPMTYHREDMSRLGVHRASELRHIPNGQRTRIGGCVIARQRPGTAKGFVFLSLEDETGVANAIIMPDLFQKNRLLVTSEKFLMIEGILQNQDNVISVKAERVLPLSVTRAQTTSHDFY
jgi:error-prone DNA polymerase